MSQKNTEKAGNKPSDPEAQSKAEFAASEAQVMGNIDKFPVIANTTIVVSGSPRTGTSTMMRMLEAGGVPVLVSKKSKEATPQSPYGWYEVAFIGPVFFKSEPAWSNGKAIKLVAPYISWLPLDRDLKVIFMLRDMNEIVASLLAQQSFWEYSPEDCVRDARRYLERNNIDVHFVQYRDMLKYPKSTSIGIADFLGIDSLDIDAMVGIVDPKARYKFKKDLMGKDRETNVLTFDVNKYTEDGDVGVQDTKQVEQLILSKLSAGENVLTGEDELA